MNETGCQIIIKDVYIGFNQHHFILLDRRLIHRVNSPDPFTCKWLDLLTDFPCLGQYKVPAIVFFKVSNLARLTSFHHCLDYIVSN